MLHNLYELIPEEWGTVHEVLGVDEADARYAGILKALKTAPDERREALLMELDEVVGQRLALEGNVMGLMPLAIGRHLPPH